MKALTVKEIQEKNLQILIFIDKVCRDNNLRYTLASGTMLGAVREGGFIPWDDDADIRMPRPDYDKLLDYFYNNEIPFCVHNIDTDRYSPIYWTRICDKETIFERFNEKFDYGCFVDLFPVDGIGNDIYYYKSKEKKIDYYKRLMFFNRFLNYSLKVNKSLKSKISILLRYIHIKLLGPKNIIKKMLIGEWTYNDSKYVSNVSSPNFIKQIFEKSMYEELTDWEFEGHTFKICKNYDLYLRTEYGDNYMTPPPPDKRGDGNHGSFNFYYKEK
ncbi:MAG: LicD family protein [Abditibacteriota bacterium]|nr:LicD family protein [Abditibacteriota bacterium]